MDGFDRSGPEGGEVEALALPATVKAGLLTHPVFYDKIPNIMVRKWKSSGRTSAKICH
jgi:hypothetical protein